MQLDTTCCSISGHLNRHSIWGEHPIRPAYPFSLCTIHPLLAQGGSCGEGEQVLTVAGPRAGAAERAGAERCVRWTCSPTVCLLVLIYLVLI